MSPTPGRHRRAKEVFLAALERAPEERPAALDAACGDDAELRREVESLLGYAVGDLLAPGGAARADTDFEAGEVFAGRYRIVSRIGEGGMGAVYRADDLTLGEPIALKLLRRAAPAAAERLLSEVRLARKVTHPGVCRVFDVGDHEGELFFTMEYVAGEDLAVLLARAGRLSSERVAELGRQLCAGLAAAHAQGVLHRDLKPANVLVDGEGRVRITDFGIATPRESIGTSRAGTPAYMAPEQLIGGPQTERTDLYALGLVLYELASGRRPFAADTPEALRDLQLGGRLEPPSRHAPGLDPTLERCILRALDRDPSRRFASAEAMAESLGGDSWTRGSAPARPATAQGERRQVTAVFFGLAGAADLAARLDPEDLHDVTRAYQEAVAAVVARFGGSIDRYLGDGLLVLFGYPRAHGDDAVRAVRAALGVRRAIRDLDRELRAGYGGRSELTLRAGVHTGPVVVGAVGGSPDATQVLGNTMNVAARIQEQARPGAVVVSDATLRLVVDHCEVSALGSTPLEGVSEPVALHQVERVHDEASIEPVAYRTPFVGREQELGLLGDRFEETAEGRGQVVLVSGEPGIGKSRLLHRFRESLAGEPHVWLACRSTPYMQQTPFFGAAQLLRRALGPSTGSEPVSRGRLEAHLAGLHPPLSDAAPVLASLLSLSHAADAPGGPEAELRRLETLRSLVAWLHSLSAEHPVVIVCEDVHWSDPSTLEFVTLAIEQCAAARVLLLLSARPDFAAPWPSRSNLTPLPLHRLGRGKAREVIRGLACPDALSDETSAAILERAEGIPLYVEELVRLALEAGETTTGGGRALVAIPETLQDSLMARLDRLGADKRLVQLCAVLGREFDSSLLEAISDEEPAALQRALARLVEGEVLHRRGAPPEIGYAFAHALLQEAAQQSTLRRQRRELHARVAETLSARFPERCERQPELVALHFAAGGRPGEAVDFGWRAAQRAAHRSAWSECAGQITATLAALEDLPPGRDRDQRELDLRFLYAVALNAAQGFGVEPLGPTLERVIELCRALDDDTRLFEATYALWWVASVSGDEAGTLRLLGRLGRIAERLDLPERRMRVQFVAGQGHFYRGRPEEALDCFRAAHEALAEVREEPDPLVWAIDPGLELLAVEGCSQWLAGRADRARQGVDAAVAAAERLGRPYSLAGALFYQGYVRALEEEPAALGETAERLIQVAQDNRLPGFVTIGQVLRGAARARSGFAAEGAEEIRGAVARLEQAQAVLFTPFIRVQLAVALLLAGRPEGALEAAADGLARAGGSLDRNLEPELLRLRGQALLALGRPRTEALACFRRALELARAKGLRALELRAARDLDSGD